MEYPESIFKVIAVVLIWNDPQDVLLVQRAKCRMERMVCCPLCREGSVLLFAAVGRVSLTAGGWGSTACLMLFDFLVMWMDRVFKKVNKIKGLI